MQKESRSPSLKSILSSATFSLNIRLVQFMLYDLRNGLLCLPIAVLGSGGGRETLLPYHLLVVLGGERLCSLLIPLVQKARHFEKYVFQFMKMMKSGVCPPFARKPKVGLTPFWAPFLFIDY